jgi:type IV secretion system protein VirD4
MLNKSGNECSGVLSTAMSFLALYRDPLVARCTETSDFAIRDLVHAARPVSLYLMVPPSDKDRLKPLVRLIINQVARTLTEQRIAPDGHPVAPYRQRLLLMLDEFPALGKLEVFQESLAYFAGYGLKAYLIAQDLTQLHAAYGHDEQIVSNCHVRIAAAPNRLETAELLSKMAGSATLQHVARTYTGSRLQPVLLHTLAAEQAIERRLLTPDEALRLPADDLLIFVAGHAPIYGQKIKYYHDREFSRRARCAAPTSVDRRPPAAGMAPSAGAPTLPVVAGAPALPLPVLPVDGHDTPRSAAPGAPGVTPPAPARNAPRTWRRRTAPPLDPELVWAEPATASPAGVAVPEQAPTERPGLASDLLDMQRWADAEHPPKRQPRRERGEEPELGR